MPGGRRSAGPGHGLRHPGRRRYGRSRCCFNDAARPAPSFAYPHPAPDPCPHAYAPADATAISASDTRADATTDASAHATTYPSANPSRIGRTERCPDGSADGGGRGR